MIRLSALSLALLAASSLQAAPRGLDVRDLVTFERVSEPTLSPDANALVYALRQVDFAALNAGDNPLTHFNIGTLYFEMGAHDKAARHAARAQELGFPRDTLINKLKGVNMWTPQADASSVIPAAAAASAAPGDTASAPMK